MHLLYQAQVLQVRHRIPRDDPENLDLCHRMPQQDRARVLPYQPAYLQLHPPRSPLAQALRGLKDHRASMQCEIRYARYSHYAAYQGSTQAASSSATALALSSSSSTSTAPSLSTSASSTDSSTKSQSGSRTPSPNHMHDIKVDTLIIVLPLAFLMKNGP